MLSLSLSLCMHIYIYIYMFYICSIISPRLAFERAAPSPAAMAAMLKTENIAHAQRVYTDTAVRTEHYMTINYVDVA